MPKEIAESGNAGKADSVEKPRLNLLTVSDDRINLDSERLIPTARFAGLAGVTGGVTEVVFSRLNLGAASQLEKAANRLANGAADARVSYTALDQLTASQSRLLGLTFEKGALNGGTAAKVTQLVNAAEALSVFGEGTKVGHFGQMAMNREATNVLKFSRELSTAMKAERLCVENTVARSFARGAGKGIAAMSVGIGAGYVVDQLTGAEQMRINSPLGLAMDAGAGMALLWTLPGKYKYPLAVAALALPRVCEAKGVGLGVITPASFSGDSIWKPNAVDALGLGLAVGLPVDGRIKMAVGGAAIVAGRIYNAVQEAPKYRK